MEYPVGEKLSENTSEMGKNQKTTCLTFNNVYYRAVCLGAQGNYVNGSRC